jgi:ABC-type multidrug transport system fused ATPase/permease subunit
MSTFQKFWQLLTRSQRRSAMALLGLMLVGMVLETFGIALVMPALGLMTTDDLAASYPSLEPWLAAVGHPTQRQLVVAGMLAFVGVIGMKVLVLAFLAWRQAKFSFGLQADISERLFAGYLRQGWAFHLQRNSAQLIRNALREVNLLTDASLSMITMLTECLVAVGISMLLLFIEPVGAVLVVTTLGLAAWGFQRFTRALLLRWGQARQHHEGMRIQHLQQGLGGAKDVKLLGREADFIAQYRLHNDGTARIFSHVTTVQQLPRLWLELLAAVGLASLVLVMVAQGKPLGSLLPALGVFAIAAFRLMPSISRIMGSVQSMRYSMPAVDTLYHELALLHETSTSTRDRLLEFETGLEIDEVTYRYPDAAAPALQNVSFRISRGASIGIIGGSGAGKSTLVDVILGLLTPASGQVRVDGIDIQTNLRGWQDQIGYVPQSVFLTDDTLRRNVAFGLADDQIDDAAVRRAIRAAQLEDFINGLPEGLDALVGERGVKLSGGQRQRIGIARALYHDPSVLVLDEATSSLDTATEQGVMAAVNALHGNKTILIVAHRLSTVQHCDRLIRLEQGRVVEEGTFRNVMKIEEAIAK